MSLQLRRLKKLQISRGSDVERGSCKSGSQREPEIRQLRVPKMTRHHTRGFNNGKTVLRVVHTRLEASSALVVTARRKEEDLGQADETSMVQEWEREGREHGKRGGGVLIDVRAQEGAKHHNEKRAKLDVKGRKPPTHPDSAPNEQSVPETNTNAS